MTRVKHRGLAACLALLCAGATGVERSAPLGTMSVLPTEQLSLGGPELRDAIHDGRMVIRSLSFRVERGEVPEGAVLAIEIEGPGGQILETSTRLSPSMGRVLSIPIEAEIPRDREGLFLASVRVARGEDFLFQGSYMFGYPRYETSRKLRKVVEGAFLKDDFEGPGPDETIWLVRSHEPGRFRGEQRDGRYWIQVTGETSYNGLTSRERPDTRDVVAVCRTGVSSPEGAGHRTVLHVCGATRFSPDHWFEVALGDKNGKRSTATSSLVVPALQDRGYRGSYTLPFPASDGYLVKIECRGEDNRCSGFVQVDEEWWQIGDSFEVPARETKLEIKTSGFGASRDGTSTAWFDDCRFYPRPETHYVSIVLRDADGLPVGTHMQGGHPFCFGPDNRALEGCGFSIKLLAEDGVTLISETETSSGFGWGLLGLRSAPWDLYPASAIVRIESGGRQIGPDHAIRKDGVDGLYPDDVYEVILE